MKTYNTQSYKTQPYNNLRIAKLLINTATAALLGSVLSSCNKSSPPATDTAASTATNTDTSTTSTTSSVPIAYCNTGSSNSFAIKQKVFVDTNKKIAPDWMVAKIFRIPDDFATSGAFLNIFRWKVAADGTNSIDSTPLTFYLQNSVSKEYIVSNQNFLRWDQVKTAANGASPQNFFDNMRLIISTGDTASEYQVLRFAFYDTNKKVIEEFDALMPAFFADPADYAKTPSGGTRADVLQKLHPFASLVGQGLTKDQFKLAADAYCF